MHVIEWCPNELPRRALLIALLCSFPSVAAVANNLQERLAADADLTIFSSALEMSGLSSTLREKGPFTLFVPSNGAMRNEGSAFLLEKVLLTDSNRNLLSRIISYHVVPGTRLIPEMIDGSVDLDTLSGERLSVARFRSSLAVGPVSVVTRKIETENGVMYVVDRLLWPDYQPVTEYVVNLGTANDELIMSPRKLVFAQGQFVRLVIKNPSQTTHYFWSNEFGGRATRTHYVSVDIGEITQRTIGPAGEEHPALEIKVAPGGTAVWDLFTEMAGRYKWGCSNPEHAHAGMTGEVRIAPAS